MLDREVGTLVSDFDGLTIGYQNYTREKRGDQASVHTNPTVSYHSSSLVLLLWCSGFVQKKGWCYSCHSTDVAVPAIYIWPCGVLAHEGWQFFGHLQPSQMVTVINEACAPVKNTMTSVTILMKRSRLGNLSGQFGVRVCGEKPKWVITLKTFIHLVWMMV